MGFPWDSHSIWESDFHGYLYDALSMAADWTNIMILDDYKVFIYTLLLYSVIYVKVVIFDLGCR